VSRSERTANLYTMANGELAASARTLWAVTKVELEGWPALAHDRLRLERRLTERAEGGRGFFAGAVHDAKDMSDGDGRSGHPRFQAGNLERNLALLAQFEEMAREKGATPAQLALAWLMAQGEDIIPIPSNKTRTHLDENIKSVEIKLGKEDLARLDRLFRPDAVAGPRSRDMHRVNI